MDERALLLIEELATHPKDKGLDFERWRHRFQAVFAEPIDEESRVVLLDSYKALLDLMERGLEKSGGNVALFREARETDWRALCLQEAQLVTGTEQIHPSVIGAIVERELAAGRMQESDYTRLIAAGAEVLGERPTKKKGWLTRLFGG